MDGLAFRHIRFVHTRCFSVSRGLQTEGVPEMDQHNESILWDAREVSRFTGLSRTTIWRLEARGDFPARRQVTDGRVAWVADEVRTWARSLPEVGGR
jgi:prophage regulatory protein